MKIFFIKFINTTVFISCFIMSYNALAQQQIVKPINDDVARLLEKRDFNEENDIGRRELIVSEDMALQLAELYIKNFYDESVSNDKPYIIADNGTEWVVQGQLPKDPIQILGGTFLIIISKIDGKVLAITHNR